MVGGQTLDPGDELTSFIRDALRFISAFIVPISESAPHIYLSALPFSPERSLVADKFCSRFPNTPKVIEGKPVQWPMTIFTAEHHKGFVRSIVFSPDEKTFASISVEEIATMYICDSETGHRISGPFESKVKDSHCHGGCFDPDGKHFLLQCGDYAVVWDIERGKKQLEFEANNSAFVCHGRYHGRIASTHQDQTEIWVKLRDAGNGVLLSNELFKVSDAGINQLSPDGRFLAVQRISLNVIELWNVEDGKDVQRFPYPSGTPSLHFSPTSDSLVAAFDLIGTWDRIYLWRLDTQAMASINVQFGRTEAVVHLPSTDRIFVPQDRTVEVREVSMSGRNMISKIEPPMTSKITCVCSSRDGRRLLVGGKDGSVSMWSLNAEDIAGDWPVARSTHNDNIVDVISLSRSGKIAATESSSGHVEFRDTTTGEVVGRTDIEYECDMKIVFSPDDNQIAFWHDSVITICDVMCPEKNRLSFDPWPRGKCCLVGKVAFRTHDDLVICAKLDGSDTILHVWRLTDLECAFSLDFKIPKYSRIFLAPDGLTVVIDTGGTVLCYSWDHDTGQFDPFHFTDEAHLDGFEHAYSPDGKLLACQSPKDFNIRVWHTRTGRLCGKPMPMPGLVDTVALSPVLKDPSLGDQIIAVGCSNTISVYDVHTGHLHDQLYAPENAIIFSRMSFIQDGTKLALHSFHEGAMRIWDLRAEYSHAIHGYALFPLNMKEGWMMDQDGAPLFWVPSEHREFLWVSRPRVIIGVPREKATMLDLSSSRLGNEWTECIDIGWLKVLREKEVTRKLLE